MKLRTLPAAELESAQAAIWYEAQREGAGAEFLAEVDAALDRIRANPASMPALEDYTGPHELRRCRLRRFPYVVQFVLRRGDVLVLAVVHAHRRPLHWLARLPKA